MKRLLAIIVAILFLCSCGSSDIALQRADSESEGLIASLPEKQERGASSLAPIEQEPILISDVVIPDDWRAVKITLDLGSHTGREISFTMQCPEWIEPKLAHDVFLVDTRSNEWNAFIMGAEVIVREPMDEVHNKDKYERLQIGERTVYRYIREYSDMQKDFERAEYYFIGDKIRIPFVFVDRTDQKKEDALRMHNAMLASIELNEPSHAELEELGAEMDAKFAVRMEPETPEEILTYFIELLESGGNVSHVWYPETEQFYRDSLFRDIPVQVLSWKEIPCPNTLDEGNAFAITIDIKDTNKDGLRPGQQEWIFCTYWRSYEETMVPERLYNRSKYDSWVKTADNPFALQILKQKAVLLGDTLFVSPKELPIKKRGSYILENAPDEFFEKGGSMTLDNANHWARVFFGEELSLEVSYDRCIQLESGELAYEGGGIPYIPNNFIYSWVDSEGTHLIYEVYRIRNRQTVQRMGLPEQVVQYTVKDGFVWSAADITNQVVLSPYLDVMLAH